MRFFKSFGDSLNYKEILPLDGAFSRAHALYSGSPIFFGSDGETLVQDARKLALPPDVEGSSAVEYLHMFDGTESGYDRASRRIIWKAYWLEYIHAFDQLISVLSDSIVTVYVGRQAIELGFKYLLLEKTGQIEKTHDLGKLAHALISEGESPPAICSGSMYFAKNTVRISKAVMQSILDFRSIKPIVFSQVIIWT